MGHNQTNSVSREQYDEARAGRLSPDDLNPGDLYMERVRTPPEVIGPFATDQLVKVIRVYDRDGYYQIPVQPVSDDGGVKVTEVEAPKVTEDGIIVNADPADPERGYFLSAIGDLEEELRGIEEEILIPVRRSPPGYDVAA